MRFLHNLDKKHGLLNAVFKIPTGSRGDVFMRVSRSDTPDETRSVVIVDSSKFLKLWRANPSELHADVAHGTPYTWKSDYKFHYPEAHFAEGFSNPVPLAEVSCYVNIVKQPVPKRFLFFFKRWIQGEPKPLPFISIRDGVTRSIWLMTFGTSAFPVEVSTKQAGLLQHFAGLPGGHPIAVSDLIPDSFRTSDTAMLLP